MSESNETGMRTSEHMSETPNLNEQPQGITTEDAQPEAAPSPVRSDAQDTAPALGGVVNLQSGSLLAGAKPETAKLDPVTKLSNMIKAQVAATVTTDSPAAPVAPVDEVPLITSAPAAPVFVQLPGFISGQSAAPAPAAAAEQASFVAQASFAAPVISAERASFAEQAATAATAPASSQPVNAGGVESSAAAAPTGAATLAMPVAPAPEAMAGPGEEPEKPTVPDLPSDKKGQEGQRPLSLFEPVEVLRGGMLPEDLPFANEVDAALARRPLRMERYLSLAVGCGILLFILWAAFASIDEVTHAEGQVISSQRTQAIQNLEGGILRNILVSEGQTVEKGDVLAQLDNEMAASSYRDAINKALDNTLAIIRLEAELKGEAPQFPENVEEWVRDVVGPQNMMTALTQAHQAIKDQMSAYQARTQQKSAELLLLESQYQQRIHEVGELSARKRQLDESLALAVEQRDIAAGLLQKRSTSRVDYLNQQQRVVQLSGEVEALASTIPKAQSAAQETSQRMTFRRAEIDAAVTDELNKRRMDLASINETLSAGGDRVTRTELRSPVRGTVKRIAVTTLGGVVKPGESIMEIVPLDDTLLVEAKVRPSDVAFLRPGQRAMVKVSAYDFSIYGGLEGALEQISADTIEDKRGEFHYLVKVRTNKTAIQHQDKSLPIIPGMMATVDILIGKKTVLDYLLKPILKARDRALRER